MKSTTTTKGKWGENIAKDFLADKGYRIKAINYRHRRFEIDVIAQKNNWLVFVEVKMRKSTAFGYPEDFVNRKKLSNLQRAAEAYIEEQRWGGWIRFDIIAIEAYNNQYDISHFMDVG